MAKIITPVVAFALLSLSFFSFKSDELKPISLEHALAQGIIDLEVQCSDDDFDVVVLELSMTNNSSRNQSIEINSGTQFSSINDSIQDMVIMENMIVDLNPTETEKVTFETYCTQSHNRYPDIGSKYTLNRNPNKDLFRIAKYKDENPEIAKEEFLLQSAIWSVTNGEDVGYLFSDQIEAAKGLRELCCDITGQEDVWYNKDRNINISESGYVACEPTTISGSVTFQNEEAAVVALHLYDEEGNIIWEKPNHLDLPEGRLTTYFELTVEGWPSGTYLVQYSTKKEVILEQEFVL